MSTTPINPASTVTTPAASTTAAASTDSLANQNVFLQLLVAQLKNQDPDSPADGTAFVTQLAQFSELSNTTQMAADISTIKQELTPPASTTTSTTST